MNTPNPKKSKLKKFTKVVLTFIITLLAITCIGYLSISWGFALTGLMGFLESNRTGFVLLQILVIILIVSFYPKFVDYLINKKLQADEITWDDLPQENKDNLAIFTSRWTCAFVLVVFFILGNM